MLDLRRLIGLDITPRETRRAGNGSNIIHSKQNPIRFCSPASILFIVCSPETLDFIYPSLVHGKEEQNRKANSAKNQMHDIVFWARLPGGCKLGMFLNRMDTELNAKKRMQISEKNI